MQVTSNACDLSTRDRWLVHDGRPESARLEPRGALVCAISGGDRQRPCTFDSVQWHVLHDLTPPEVSIESASSANESDIVLVVVNATDSTSDLVELVELRATSPDGRVTVLDAGVNDSEFTVQPDSSGSWTVHVTVRDGAGLSQTASHVMQVSNLPPVAGVRLNGAMVEHGDAFQVKLGQPLLLDASTSSDTASDVLDLNHVWWIGDDVRLSGVERLTEDRFQKPAPSTSAWRLSMTTALRLNSCLRLMSWTRCTTRRCGGRWASCHLLIGWPSWVSSSSAKEGQHEHPHVAR